MSGVLPLLATVALGSRALADDALPAAGSPVESGVTPPDAAPPAAPLAPTALADSEAWTEERDVARYERGVVSLARAHDGVAWLIGLDDGAVLRSIDGAHTWTRVLRAPNERDEVDDEEALLEGTSTAADEMAREMSTSSAAEDTTTSEETNADGTITETTDEAAPSGSDAAGVADSTINAIASDPLHSRESGVGEHATVWFAPDDPLLALVGRSDGTWRSEDGGLHWSRVDAEADIRCFLLLPGADVLVAGTGGGVRQSADRGQSWIDVEDSTDGAEVAALALVSGQVYAGTSAGLYSSVDGLRWVKRPLSEPVTAILPDPAWPGGLWVATPAGVRRSDDAGSTWMGLGRQALKGATGLAALTGAGHIFAWGSDGAWESLDGGVSWKPVSAGLRDPDVRAVVLVDGRPIAATRAGIWRLRPARLREFGAGGLGTRPSQLRDQERMLGTLVRVATERTGLDLDHLKARNVAAKGWLPRVTIAGGAAYHEGRSSAYLTSQTVEDRDLEWGVGAYMCFGGCASGIISDALDSLDSSGDAGMISADFDEAGLDRTLEDARLTVDMATDDAYYAINGEIVAENSDAFAATNVAQKIRKYRYEVADQVAGAWSALARMRSTQPPESLQASVEQTLQVMELEARLDLYTDGAYTRAKLME